MAKFWEFMQPEHIEWIVTQKLFWVGTSPLNPDGRVNISPKGVAGTFHVINERRVWYQDLTGSGVETISHLRENGRITVMFIAFEGAPKIVRLFGRGTVYEFGSAGYSEFIPPEKRIPGSRAAIVVDVYQVSSSCGFAVPFYSYQGERRTLTQYLNTKEQKDHRAEADAEDPSTCKGESGIKEYWELKNAKSLDGLPGLSSAPKTGFRLTGYDVNHWTPSPPHGEPARNGEPPRQVGKDVDVLMRPMRYADVRFLVGVVTGGLLTTIFYAILLHTQSQLSSLLL